MPEKIVQTPGEFVIKNKNKASWVRENEECLFSSKFKVRVRPADDASCMGGETFN